MKDLNISYSQKGLAYFPDNAIYATFYLKDIKDQANHELWQTLARELDKLCESTDLQTIVLLGVGFELWTAWSEELALPLPKGMGSRDKLTELSQAFGNSGGDLWFHIKSDSTTDAHKALDLIERHLTTSKRFLS